MSHAPNPEHRTVPKRKKIFFGGYQLRYAILVAGSLFVLLLFAGFHAIFVATTSLPSEVLSEFKPELVASTWRLFIVGLMYIAVVTLAAVFISHRLVGPAKRLEQEIKELTRHNLEGEHLHVREGDEFEGLVGAINKMVDKVRGVKRK